MPLSTLMSSAEESKWPLMEGPQKLNSQAATDTNFESSTDADADENSNRVGVYHKAFTLREQS